MYNGLKYGKIIIILGTLVSLNHTEIHSEQEENLKVGSLLIPILDALIFHSVTVTASPMLPRMIMYLLEKGDT